MGKECSEGQEVRPLSELRKPSSEELARATRIVTCVTGLHNLMAMARFDMTLKDAQSIEDTLRTAREIVEEQQEILNAK